MFHRVSIRWRMTILSALLLSICCISLTFVLNYSANRLVDQMDAIVLTPALPASSAQPSQADVMTDSEVAQPATTIQAAKQVFRYDSLLSMLFIIVGGSALTYYIAGKALKPLHGLNHQVKNINAQTLSTSLDVPSTHDEIANLTESFNAMIKQLNNTFLNQKRFSSSAAHELRTPLTILQTKVDVFKKQRNHTTEEYDTFLQVIEKQIYRLRTLVGDLLAMSNDVPLEKSEFDIKEVLTDIQQELSILAHQKNISIMIDGDVCNVYGDLDALYRVFYNLIENAIKYNKNEGYVRIEVRSINVSTCKILIKDSAVKIPDELKKDIFEPFYTIDKSRSREMGGVGLGLTLAKQIIEKHQGSILVKDEANGGNCFEVCLNK